MSKQQIGLVGLAVMGENLALNIEEKGFSIAVYNRTISKVDDYLRRNPGKKIVGAKTVAEFVSALERPRRILMMVKAGKPVDDTIALLRPHLEKDDMLVDGGNEYFKNTVRRAAELEGADLYYVGMGVSGGAEGARRGPSLMPGGHRFAYDQLAPILTKVAAQVEDGPCVDYMGPGGAGHYVKMVHNGIEYGDMQLIAEAYDLLRTLGGFSADALADLFADWNRSELQSFLIEITAAILRRKEEASKAPLVDLIVDASGMKGTGKWTVQQAAELSTPIPTIASAVETRIVSAQRAERLAAAKVLSGPRPSVTAGDKKQLIEDVRHALYAAKICSYAQGMNLLKGASAAYAWNLPLNRIARIWKGGCIIRAKILGHIQEAYERSPQLPSLLVDREFAREIGERQAGWRRVLALAVQSGLGVPAMGASLAYYDNYRRERLPANLIQAQRDLFGAHTYERLDRAGTFHTNWTA
jgi:6-phosphogluconate dehydrogenase